MSADLPCAWLAVVLVAGCSSAQTRTDAPRVPDTCSDRQTLTTPSGDVDCYPYRCVAGQCLHACETRADCAGAEQPGELPEQGWPLDCGDGRCVPLPPEHVTDSVP
jgi:hypothetical protein